MSWRADPGIADASTVEQFEGLQACPHAGPQAGTWRVKQYLRDVTQYWIYVDD